MRYEILMIVKDGKRFYNLSVYKIATDKLVYEINCKTKTELFKEIKKNYNNYLVSYE